MEAQVAIQECEKWEWVRSLFRLGVGWLVPTPIFLNSPTNSEPEIMTKYRISSNQTSTNLGDEAVILNHQKGLYYSLDSVGQTVWNYVQEKPATLEELVAIVGEKYEVDEHILKEDIQELIDDLLKEKLIEAMA